jgi:hypothetical protein
VQRAEMATAKLETAIKTVKRAVKRVSRSRFVSDAAIRERFDFVGDVDGGRCRARTYDPLIKSQLLYQLS